MLSDTEAKSHLSANITHRLKELDWSQLHLAQVAGETPMMISRIIRKEHVPSAAVLARIAESLGVSADYLLSAPPQKKSRKRA